MFDIVVVPGLRTPFSADGGQGTVLLLGRA